MLYEGVHTSMLPQIVQYSIQKYAAVQSLPSQTSQPYDAELCGYTNL